MRGSRLIKKKLIGSVCILFVCLAMLTGTSLAWFTDNVSVGVGKVQTATYALDVTCTSGSAQQANSDSEDSNSTQYTMNGTNCTFQLKAGNNDKAAKSGYCVITGGGNTYITTNIQKGGTFTVTVHAPAGTQITFSSKWGKPTDEQLAAAGNNRLASSSAITLPGYQNNTGTNASTQQTKPQNSQSNATTSESKPTTSTDSNKTPEQTTPETQPTTSSEGAE